MQTTSDIRKIAFLGDYLPRKCGIATFTADVCAAMAAEFPQTQCLVVPVNNVEGGYDYPAEVRFEIEEQDLSSYLRAADFLKIANVDVVHQPTGRIASRISRRESSTTAVTVSAAP